MGEEVLLHQFRDGSSSIVIPKAVVKQSWQSGAKDSLKLTLELFIGVLQVVPGTNFYLSVAASFDSADQATLRGIPIRGKVGFFPKDMVHFFAPVTIHYSPHTFKLKVTYTYWPWNCYDILLSTTAISYNKAYTIQ